MSWVGYLLKDSELFILFAENSQILLKISVIPILLTFIYLVAINLLVNNQLNSSLRHIIVTIMLKPIKIFDKIIHVILVYYDDKVHTFWEGHIILQNLRLRLDRYYIGQIYGGDFAKICGMLRIYEL